MTTALQLLGYVALIVGAYWLAPWLGIIVFGFVLLVIAWANEQESAQ